MSWLSNIFGGKKEKPVNPNDTINKTNDSVQLLQKREKLLEKKISEEVEKAKDYLRKGNKNAAALCMKRKKNYEQQITRLHNQMMNLESINLKLEEAAMDVETIKAQSDAAKALKGIYKNVYVACYSIVLTFVLSNVEKIDDEMEKVRNAIDDGIVIVI